MDKTELQSSSYWATKHGLRLGEDILDPDGWDRKNFEESWAEKITFDEFYKRVLFSTVNSTLIQSKLPNP